MATDDVDEVAASALQRLRSAGDARTAGPFGARWRAALDRVRALGASRHRTAALMVGVIALVVGAGAVVALTIGAGVTSGSQHDVPPVTSIPMVSSSTTISGPTTGGLVVHVAGAVRAPGVYRVAAGSRIVDLLERAGGPADGLDLDRINLAAVVIDGSRVWFPVVGQHEPAASVGGDGAAGAAGSSLIDLNRATAAQLEELPGVGPATAAAIVAHRTSAGPFRSVDDLLSVKGLGRSKVDAIRPLVTVG